MDAITHRTAHTCLFCCQTRTTAVTSRPRISTRHLKSAPGRFTSAASLARGSPSTCKERLAPHPLITPPFPFSQTSGMRYTHAPSPASLSLQLLLIRRDSTPEMWPHRFLLGPPSPHECVRDSPSNERSFFQSSCRQGASPRSQVFLVPNMTAGQSRALDRWTGCKGRQGGGGPHPQHR